MRPTARGPGRPRPTWPARGWLGAAALVCACGTPGHTLYFEGFAARSVEFPGDRVVIPTRRWNELFLVDGKLNETPVTMVVDTGLYETFLRSTLVAGLTRDAEARCHIDSLTIGPLVLRDLMGTAYPIEQVAEALGVPIDGILGLSAFRELLLTFDYPAGELSVARGSLARAPDTLDFEWDDQHRPVAPLALCDYRTEVMLDTGAAAPLMLPLSSEVTLVEPLAQADSIVNLSGKFRASMGRAACEARIGTARGASVVLEPPAILFSDTIPIAGAQLFGDFAVTFDQRRRLVRFTRATRT